VFNTKLSKEDRRTGRGVKRLNLPSLARTSSGLNGKMPIALKALLILLLLRATS